MARTWDKTKAMEENTNFCCTSCTWETYLDFGEYSLSELITGLCPVCGGATRQFRVYLCPICGKRCGGVDDYNYHTLHHWFGYHPLPQEVRAAMAEHEPQLFKQHQAYIQTHYTE